MAERLTRADFEDYVCVVYDPAGNAYSAFPFTPEDLDREAWALRDSFGELNKLTMEDSPFLQRSPLEEMEP